LSKKTIVARFKITRIWPLNNKVIDEKTTPTKAFTYFRTIRDDLMLTLTKMMNTKMMKNKMGSVIAMGC
jgi:hypothetical protein